MFLIVGYPKEVNITVTQLNYLPVQFTTNNSKKIMAY